MLSQYCTLYQLQWDSIILLGKIKNADKSFLPAFKKNIVSILIVNENLSRIVVPSVFYIGIGIAYGLFTSKNQILSSFFNHKSIKN